MNILDRVYDTWSNLERSFADSNRTSRSDYLKLLLSRGSTESMFGLLNQCSAVVNGTGAADDSTKLAYVQARISFLLKIYNHIPDEIDNLDDYVSLCLNMADMVNKARPFPLDFHDRATPFSVITPKVLFSKSPYGMDVFTPKSIHILEEIEPNVAVVLKKPEDFMRFKAQDQVPLFAQVVANYLRKTKKVYRDFTIFTNKEIYSHTKDKSGKEFYKEDGMLFVAHENELCELVYL